MADFTSKDCFFCGAAPAIVPEIVVSNHLDHFRTQCFRGACQRYIACGIRGSGYGSQLISLLIHNPLAAYNDDVLLKVIEVFDALDKQISVQRMFGYQDDVWLPVRCAKGDVAGLPSHDFNDGNPAVTFGRRANALHALGGHEHGRGVTGSDVVDDLVEIENRTGIRALIAIADSGIRIDGPDPFVRLARIIQPQIVIDRLWRKYGWKTFGQRLQTVERAVTTDADQPVDTKPFETRYDEVQFNLVVRVDIVARRADQGPPLRRVNQFREFPVNRGSAERVGHAG